MSLVTIVNGFPVLRPGLLAHSFCLMRGSLTPERLDRALKGIIGGYEDREEVLFISIHGFDGRYNASIGGEYGIVRRDRTSGIALVFTEELNHKIRNQEEIPDEVLNTYLSMCYRRRVLESKININLGSLSFRDALKYGDLDWQVSRLDNEGKSLLDQLGVRISGTHINRPHTYTTTILDLYATQKMREGDFSMNTMTNSEDGVRAFEIKERVAVPLRVMPNYFEGLLVSRYFDIDGIEMTRVKEPYVDKIGNMDALLKIVDGRVPILVYCEFKEEVPKDAQEVQEITPFGYIPINTRPDGRDGRIDVQRRHYIARL